VEVEVNVVKAVEDAVDGVVDVVETVGNIVKEDVW
jgi:hypothetical protein